MTNCRNPYEQITYFNTIHLGEYFTQNLAHERAFFIVPKYGQKKITTENRNISQTIQQIP